MRKYRTARISSASLLLAAGALGATGLPAAADTAPSGAEQTRTAAGKSQAAKGFCTSPSVWEIFLDTGKWRHHKGRSTILMTGARFDEEAKGWAEDIATGDRVEVQRSYMTFEMKRKHWYPSKETIEAGGGYRSCGKKASWSDANLRDSMVTPTVQLQIPGTGRSYAVRSCVFPVEGGKKGCTKWYVDHK
ncbi:hypothetical protein [Streptomyces sp. NPDC058092]|uniref:hypothetical protein n=1 Tax=Streptomyces sp. NPDC058092 TaxID=3346336 RepID=UPI0036EAADC7